jgi:hypothetical protein
VRPAATLLAIALAACGDGGTAEDLGDGGACYEVQRDIPVQISRDVDILFVMDGSVSMLDRIETLQVNVRRFADVLENVEGGLPSVQIGVVSSDVQTHEGALVRPRPECGIDGNYLRDIAYANDERDANYTGDFGDAFSCLLMSQPLGSSLEEPLEAVRRALDGGQPANAGFVREHAFLFVVFVTDEDDCSGGEALMIDTDEARSAYQCFADGVVCDQGAGAIGIQTGCAANPSPASLTPIDGYANFLRGLKQDGNMVMVSALAAGGDPVVTQSASGLVLAPACPSETMEWPAIRLRAFLDLFPQRSTSAHPCGDDWSDLMVLIADMLRTVLGFPCIEDTVDLDRDTPGIQAECVISELRGEQEVILPACTSDDPPDAERPCWRMFEDVGCADFGYRFEVLRGRENVPSGTWVRARCFGGCR